VSAANLISRAEAILKQISANAPIAVQLALETVTRTGYQPIEGLLLKHPTSSLRRH